MSTKNAQTSYAKIYLVDNAFVVSENDVWIDGVFETEDAARYMLGLSVEVQARAWASWCSKHPVPCPPIGFEDLQKEATT